MKIKKKNISPSIQSIIVLGPMKIKSAHKKEILAQKDALILLLDGAKADFLKSESSLFLFGDGDSSKKRPDFYKTNQNISDLEFLLSHLKGLKKLESCTFYGLSGGRIDHELFNIGEILRFLDEKIKQKIPPPAISIDNRLYFITAQTTHFSFKGRFSLASFEKNTIRIKGNVDFELIKWQKIKTLSSLTLSNVAHGEFYIETKKPLLLIRS